METKKIALACFVGGALCATVALLVAPLYWWLGLIAGFAGGYVAYEFREVLKAIPIAWHATVEVISILWRETSSVCRHRYNDVIYSIRRAGRYLFGEQHPFFYLGTLFAAFPATRLLASTMRQGVVLDESFEVCVGIVILLTLTTFSTCLLYFFASAGAEVWEKSSWKEWSYLVVGEHKKVPLTYLNVIRWSAEGIALTCLGIPSLICIVAFSLVWKLIKLIHSEKRLLCAFDGALGGAVSYFLFMSPAMSLSARVTCVIFGGLIGATLGVANWEIVSKRILHVGAKHAPSQ